MCLEAFTPPLFDLDVGSTDEEIMLFLGGRKAGDPIPANVITQVNPFSFEPWDSPEGVWYLYNSSNFQSRTEGRNIEVRRIGYWKPVDGNITIFRDNHTSGTKTTMEFYVDPEHFGIRTAWMMHEYHIDQKAFHGSNFPQLPISSKYFYTISPFSHSDYNSLCRVFLQNNQSSNFHDFKLPDEKQHSPFSLCDDGSSSSIVAPHISQELANQNIGADIDDMETNLRAEIDNNSSRVDVVAAIETGAVANTVTDEQQETQRKRWEKMLKLTSGVCLGLSITILTANIAHAYSSSRSRDELFLDKVSGIFALISFLAGGGLLISLQFENVKMRTQLGLYIITVISLVAAVLILAINFIT